MIRLTNPSLEAPHSVHLLATTKCNLSCGGCFYRGEGEWAVWDARNLVDEMATLGVEWLAIGGGEPFLWEPLSYILGYAHGKGISTAVTTNGTFLWDVALPDRLHISHDNMHQTTREQVWDALRHYGALGCEVGVNVIADDLEFLEGLTWCRVPTITLLLPKPMPDSPFSHWQGVCDWAIKHDAWLDACLATHLWNIGLLKSGHSQCFQGRVSMSLHSDGRAQICSNLPGGLQFITLKETWNEIRLRDWEFDCPLLQAEIPPQSKFLKRTRG